MKTLILASLFTIIIGWGAKAQEKIKNDETQSLLGGDSKISGWFVGMENSFSQLIDKKAYLPGFSFGMVINRSFHLGLIGKSFSWHETNLKFDNVMNEPCYLTGGYGGLYFETSPLSRKILHLTFPLIIAGGGANYISVDEYPEIEENGEIDYSKVVLASSTFFVLEPGINLEMNITGFMKVYTGVSYRWINGMNLPNTAKNSFNGFNLNVGLRFGKF